MLRPKRYFTAKHVLSLSKERKERKGKKWKTKPRGTQGTRGKNKMGLTAERRGELYVRPKDIHEGHQENKQIITVGARRAVPENSVLFVISMAKKETTFGTTDFTDYTDFRKPLGLLALVIARSEGEPVPDPIGDSNL